MSNEIMKLFKLGHVHEENLSPFIITHNSEAQKCTSSRQKGILKRDFSIIPEQYAMKKEGKGYTYINSVL